MKTKEELNAIRSEVEALGRKLCELTEEELQQISGGFDMPPIQEDEKYVMSFTPPANDTIYNFHVYGEEKKDFKPDFGK